MDWLLLIYTLPSQPSRKRAYVWRELKRFGALYLRDGVALLPRQGELEDHMREIVARVEEFEGEADLIVSPRFSTHRAEVFVTRFREEREAEYREVYHACVRFLRDVLHEVDADEFGFPDVDNLESELGRLRRWFGQVTGRDYFATPGSKKVEEIMEKCDRAFDHFVHTASERQERQIVQPDDIFERLGGPPVVATDDLPI